MVKKFIYPLVVMTVIMTIFIMIKKDSPQDSYFIPTELLDPTNLERVEILNIDLNESIVLTQESDFEEITSFLNAVNTRQSDGEYDNEDNVLFQLYIYEVGYYPSGPISIGENTIIYKNEIIHLTSKKFKQLHSILLRKSQNSPVINTLN